MVRPAPHMDEVNARDEASDEDDSLINPEPPAELRRSTRQRRPVERLNLAHQVVTSTSTGASTDLNETLNATTGKITNVGNTSSSPATNNTWTIRGRRGTIIAFNLTYMDMGTNEICAADFIEIFDGPSTLFRSFGKMCTARQILTLSTTNFMHVEFKTSGNATFLATYKILDTNITLTEPQGFISSPGYPLGFLKNKFYTWTIQGKPDTFIILNLIDSNLDVLGCFYNSLNIYDGPTANSSCLDSCLMSPRLIVSTSNYLHIVFYSTNSINFRGFYGKYEIRGTIQRA
ncbi:deleted in malignant brain tumors 1 protein-like [Physella acuta]|uniref:deleted in malignant brain tumors 1 protein-like n=1 Tax=Physella acuta TaxID=109671 RepID=UPI0027DBDEB7|nr:deleted in malignant brain tumors 1 protein-like [Physella acuta]